MSAAFTVYLTAHFERTFAKLASRQPELEHRLSEVVTILAADPYNLSQRHPIKKLTNIASDEGQWRIRIARYRFRYDIDNHDVYLKRCSLRREDTYR